MSRRTHRANLRWLAMLAALTVALTACGGEESSDDAADEPTDEAADDSADDEAAEDDSDATEDDAAEADATDEAGEDDAASDEPLTVYSGRSEELVGFIFDDFTAETGIEVDVRYGDTAELAITITEEGDASPADVYFGQDAGALGALQSEGVLTELPEDVLEQVDPLFRSREGQWTGTTGRVRVISYNTDNLDEGEVPESVFDLTDPAWEGRVGWAPTNGSFQAFVTAMRMTEGEDVTRAWLEDMIANGAVPFENNTGIVEGISRGEVDLGIPNHYYLFRFLAEDPDFPVANKYLSDDIGGLVNIAGVGVLESSDQQESAFELVRYLLSEDVQTYFGQNADALEFPVVEGIESPELPTLAEINPPDVDLSDLEDLQGTLELLQETGALS